MGDLEITSRVIRISREIVCLEIRVFVIPAVFTGDSRKDDDRRIGELFAAIDQLRSVETSIGLAQLSVVVVREPLIVGWNRLGIAGFQVLVDFESRLFQSAYDS